MAGINTQHRLFMNSIITPLRIASQTIWLYFPPLIFVLFAGVAFFYIPEARDMMVISAEVAHGPMLVFVAVFTWAFVTWYTSYIVVHTKCRTVPDMDGFPPLYRWFPRFLAVACYAIPAFAILSLSYVHLDAWSYYGLMCTYVTAVATIIASYWRHVSGRKFPRPVWWTSLACALLSAMISGTFFIGSYRTNLLITAITLLVFSMVHLLFMVQHCPTPNDDAEEIAWPRWSPVRWLQVELPRWELPYFRTLNVISVILAIIYFLGMHILEVARYLGPFSIPFLAFTLFLGLGNLISFIGLRVGLRLHFILIVLGLIIGSFTEPHWTRMIEGKGKLFSERATATDYFDAYFNRHLLADTGRITVVFVLADGGASRSGLWTSSMLGQLHEVYGVGFRDKLFSLAGVSGGAVGVAAYYSMLSEELQPGRSAYPFRENAQAFFGHDFLSFTLMRMIGPDLMKHLFTYRDAPDRAGYLELGMESSTDGNTISRHFKRPFSEIVMEFREELNTPGLLPILFLNSAQLLDGAPAVISNIKIDDRFNNRIDLLSIVDSSAVHNGHNDLRLSTAAVLCSRFPYVSPAGRIYDSYFIDGGYFDNSGAGVTHELILSLDKYLLEKDSTGALYSRVDYVVLHLQNSAESAPVSGKLHPAQNDLFSPLVGISNVRTMQTRVNNGRLKRYLRWRYPQADIHRHWIDYNLIEKNIVNGKRKLGPKLMESFSMNWVLSDSLQRRMQREVDERFEQRKEVTDELFMIQR